MNENEQAEELHPHEPASQRSTRQTQSYLRGLFADHGLDPKAKMGQNFLVDINLLDFIVRESDLAPIDAVLEIGTGTGGLTDRMAEHVGAVVSVELDHDFHRMATTILGPRENILLIQGDALKHKNEMNPEVLAALRDFGNARGCMRVKLVANLPFVIATPAICNLLLTPIPFERMVVMVQWEIGERLTSTVGTRDYGSLAVLVQSLADTEILRKVGPGNFWPRPKVESAIVKITPNAEKRARVGDPKKFRNFLRDLYTHRRKTLRQGLIGWPQGRKEKAFVDAKLVELGIDGSIRAEALSIEDHLRLSAAFGE